MMVMLRLSRCSRPLGSGTLTAPKGMWTVGGRRLKKKQNFLTIPENSKTKIADGGKFAIRNLAEGSPAAAKFSLSARQLRGGDLLSC